MRQAALKSNEALRSRPMRPSGRRGRTISSSARGAKPQAHHGPLERLLEVTLTDQHCARAAQAPQAAAGSAAKRAHPRRQTKPLRAETTAP